VSESWYNQGKEAAMATDTTKRQSWIQRTPGVCGGDACVRNTRITVWGLVLARRLGASEAEIVSNTQGLRADDLEAAWEYYRDHKDEIEEQIRLNEEP
jgi:uncharacterized protein (DUF433 family)